MSSVTPSPRFARRTILLFGAAGFGGALAAGAATIGHESAPVGGTGNPKRRALYNPDAPEVQTFYRVNRYPAP